MTHVVAIPPHKNGEAPMKLCPRCNHWHHGHDSAVCDVCWVELGQMSFFQDEDEPPIDTAFDREEEARGYQ